MSVRTITVILTARCNLSCTYCYQNRRQGRRMEWQTLRAAIELLLGSESPEVTLNFTGGEPLLEFPLLRRAVEYAESRSPPGKRVCFGLSTNGTLLDDERVSFLAEHCVRTQLSFDGVAAAQDRRAQASFPVLDSWLERLQRSQPVFFGERLEVAAILTGANLTRLAASVDYFLGKGIRTLRLAPSVVHDPDWRPNRIAELDRQFARVYRSSLRFYRRTGRVPLALFRKTRTDRESRPPDELRCAAASGEALTVDVDGQMTGCVRLAESYQSWPTVWLGERASSLRVGHLGHADLERRLAAYPAAARSIGLFDLATANHSSYRRCGDCPCRSRCLVCPISIGRAWGSLDPHQVPDLQCAFAQVALAYRDRFPGQPVGRELLLGEARPPELLQELRAFVGSRDGRNGRFERAPGDKGRQNRQRP